MGPEMKRKLQLRNLPNDQLLELYDAELISRLHNERDLNDTRKMVKKFLDSLGGYPPNNLLGKSFMTQFQELKPRSIARYAKMIGMFLKWYGESWEYKVKVPKEIPQYVIDEDIEKLLNAVGSKKTHKATITRDTLIIELALKSGLRRAELANLEVSDVYPDSIIVRQGKNKKDRYIPLPADIALRLNNYIKGKDTSSKVFGLKGPCIGNMICLFCKKAGIDNIHTHSLRHRYAQDLLESGADIKIVQDLLGHENLNTTQVYLATTDERKRDAVNRLDTKNSAGKNNKICINTNETLESVLNLQLTPPQNSDINTYSQACYAIDVVGQDIILDSIQALISDTTVSYKLLLFTENPDDNNLDWESEDLLQMEFTRKRRLEKQINGLKLHSGESSKKLYLGIELLQRPVRFDLEEWDIGKSLPPASYFEKPVDINVVLKYRLSN